MDKDIDTDIHRVADSWHGMQGMDYRDRMGCIGWIIGTEWDAWDGL